MPANLENSAVAKDWKRSFAFQSQRRAVPKNVQTTVRLCSFHTLGRLCSKSFSPGFTSIWANNLQVYKLDLEKAEEPKCQHLLDHRESREFQKNIYFCFTDYTKAFVWITTNWKILKEMRLTNHIICLLKNLYAGQEAIVRTGHGTIDWFKIGKGVYQAVYCHLAYLTYMQSTSCKMLG